MELNKDIEQILRDLIQIGDEQDYTIEQYKTRIVYDTFRIQNLVEKLNIPDVSKRFFVCEYHNGEYKKICVEPYETIEKARSFLNDMKDTFTYEDCRLEIISVC